MSGSLIRLALILLVPAFAAGCGARAEDTSSVGPAAGYWKVVRSVETQLDGESYEQGLETREIDRDYLAAQVTEDGDWNLLYLSSKGVLKTGSSENGKVKWQGSTYEIHLESERDYIGVKGDLSLSGDVLKLKVRRKVIEERLREGRTAADIYSFLYVEAEYVFERISTADFEAMVAGVRAELEVVRQKRAETENLIQGTWALAREAKVTLRSNGTRDEEVTPAGSLPDVVRSVDSETGEVHEYHQLKRLAFSGRRFDLNRGSVVGDVKFDRGKKPGTVTVYLLPDDPDVDMEDYDLGRVEISADGTLKFISSEYEHESFSWRHERVYRRVSAR